MVRDFQKIIGEEAKIQILKAEKRLPNIVLAPVGGGSNSMGLFYSFIEEKVELIGVEAGGLGVKTGKHASAFAEGKKGVLHGMFTYVMREDDGKIKDVYSISAGLDYPAVGPEHAYLKSIDRAKYVTINDDEAMKSLIKLTKIEGIIPAIESAHGLAYLEKLKGNLSKEDIVVVNLSGRGDKDMETINEYMEKNYE
ncbi:MAG: pyridoxal-phosphate dependent enzyme, partial [Clostridium sp.]